MSIFLTNCATMKIMQVIVKFAIIWTGAIDTIDRNTTLTYLEANDVCQCLFNNTLATISSKEENDIVQEMMIDNMILKDADLELGRDDLTIGFNTILTGKWDWIDGSEIKYTKWERETRTEPDEGELYAQIDRQIGSFNWFGRNSNPEIPFQRWFLCDTGLEFDEPTIIVEEKTYQFPLFYSILTVSILILILVPMIIFRKIIFVKLYLCLGNS